MFHVVTIDVVGRWCAGELGRTRFDKPLTKIPPRTLPPA